MASQRSSDQIIDLNMSTSYGFTQCTSSPHYPRSNGLSKRTVKTVKAMLLKSEDPHLALLSYRSIEFSWCGLSTAQLLMGRRIRSTLSQVLEKLLPKWPYLKKFEEQDRTYKRKQRKNYDNRHRTRPLLDIPDNHPVWVNTDGQLQQGRTVTSTEAPRSYVVDVPSGRVRRNHQHFIPMPEDDSTSQSPQRNTDVTSFVTRTSPMKTRSQTGTRIIPPDFFVFHLAYVVIKAVQM